MSNKKNLESKISVLNKPKQTHREELDSFLRMAMKISNSGHKKNKDLEDT